MAPTTSKSKGKLTLGTGSSSNKAASSSTRPVASSSKKPLASRPLPTKGKHRQQAAQDSEGDDDDDDMAEEEDSDDDAPMTEPDTEDEIAGAKATKSKKTAKRKRRAVSPNAFGATLQGLLGDAGAGLEDDESDTSAGAEQDDDEEGDSGAASKKLKSQSAPSTATKAATTGQSAILSLAPHIRRAAQSSRLNEKAGRLAVQARKEREERARVKDVIGGWGRPGELPSLGTSDAAAEGGSKPQQQQQRSAEAEREWQESGGAQGYERKLRKVAQRGVVKLFNAIRAAQNTTEEDVEKAELEGKDAGTAETGKKGAGATTASTKGKNVLGGKDKAVKDLSKANFLGLIKAGATGTATRT